MEKKTFWTEKEIEEMLTFETRPITLPSGEIRQVEAMRLVWDGKDFLKVCTKWNEERLVDLALRECAATGGSFEENFVTAVMAMTKVWRSNLGIDP